MPSVQSVERAFTILQALSTFPKGAGASALAKQVDLPRPTVIRLLQTMESVSVVERVPNAKTYRLGPSIFALTAQIPFAHQLTTIAHPFLQELAQRTSETVYLCLPDGDQVYYADQIDSRYQIRPRDWSGSRVPMYTVSAGKLFLADLSPLELNTYLARPLEPFTRKTLKSAAALRAHLKEVRKKGYGWARDEFEDGLVGIAAPVKDAAQNLIAAVAVTGPAYRLPRKREKEIATAAAQSADKISARLSANALQPE